MEIYPVGIEFFHADGQRRDMTKRIVALSNFANAPRNQMEKKEMRIQNRK